MGWGNHQIGVSNFKKQNNSFFAEKFPDQRSVEIVGILKHVNLIL